MQKGKNSSKKEDKKANCNSLGRDTVLYIVTQGPNN